MSSRYKVTPNKQVLEAWNKFDDRIKSALYFEIDCSSRSYTYLMANSRPSPKVIFRVNNNFIDKFETEQMPTPYINIRWYKIISLKDSAMTVAPLTSNTNSH